MLYHISVVISFQYFFSEKKKIVNYSDLKKSYF